MLGNFDPAKNEVIELIIDDSKKQNRSKAMEAVGWIREPLTGRNIRRLQYATCNYPLSMPHNPFWNYDLY